MDPMEVGSTIDDFRLEHGSMQLLPQFRCSTVPYQVLGLVSWMDLG